MLFLQKNNKSKLKLEYCVKRVFSLCVLIKSGSEFILQRIILYKEQSA